MRLFLTSLILGVLTSFSSFAQSTMLENGLNIRLHLGFAGSTYASIGSFYDGGAVNFGFEIGNRFYVYKNDVIGLAVDANWADLSIGV